MKSLFLRAFFVKEILTFGKRSKLEKTSAFSF
ncbi:hypothetical protein LBUL_1776 [Lactobacillus delbrueckii subsp. bulgaricus ATCC BAA-365]|nr:hypothetical protein LBUL_1776 [Lactobacillus delbrueckii subsp. bulgaricus ATCC BAA-365]